MVCTTYKTVFAMMAAIALGTTETEGVGVCYAPWHHTTVNEDVITADIKQITQYFSSFRTFETRMSGGNIIKIAGKAGAKVSVGVQMNDLASVDAEIQAVCDGYAEYPGAVEQVWVGNENLQNAGFGTVSADQLIGYIQKVKECTKGGVPAGANVYPIFTQGELKPIEKLQAQWEQISSKYGADKFQLTETGWPTEGEQYQGNTPSLETMQQYLNDFSTWSAGKGESFWFMMYDTTTSYTGAEYEKHFGCFDKDGKIKVSLPGDFTTGQTTQTTGSQTQGSQTGSQTQTSTDAPATPATDAPATPATVTPTDGGDQTQQGDVTPAPTEQQYAVDIPEYRTEAPTNNGGEQTPQGDVTPAPTEPQYAVDIPEYRTEAPTTPSADVPTQETPSVDVPTQDVPAVTPAANTPTVVQSGKDCAM
ncbi:Glycosyl transferase [Phytophthora palmivora]|uniref:glucan endo-1,3-beta-D-glucosidase n=1 Tax=Phytophthora palmivora TaxID=4796 RepID=A0A2P4Y8V3_9STRA|nr:Glycosyl transferase [Phytophthora palmivora]